MEELYEMESNRSRRKSKYVATCPLCGYPLLKSFSGVVELKCSRCKNMIVVVIQDGVVASQKSRRSMERAGIEPAVNN